ncbi:MAG TPA: hypothetical protein VGI23_03085 [Steroidobacteraceae bacterium]
MNWFLAVGAVALLGTAVVTLRAAEQATQRAATSAVRGESAGGPASNLDAASLAPAGGTKQHPPASAPEESATITDDPTTAPDPSQSADNNVSFPTDI